MVSNIFSLDLVQEVLEIYIDKISTNPEDHGNHITTRITWDTDFATLIGVGFNPSVSVPIVYLGLGFKFWF